MCGVVAIANTSGRVEPRQIDALRCAVAHRGPDAGGTLIRQASRFSVGLGSQRLSIIDLSPAATMPLANEDERVWIVFNGEIYNHCDLRADLERCGHRYRSRSDTETVLHAYEEYGPDCFALFNGIFACVIYDERHERVVIARDRTGAKPLYYLEERGLFACASELKALVSADLVAGAIDSAALEIYLALGYVPAPYCLVQGVRKLAAGSYGIFDGERLHTVRYWRPALTADLHPQCPWAETVAQTRATVAGAIERQMMSDVPVGVMLSGGLDSTIIAAVAQQTTPEPLHTFSIGFSSDQSDLEAIYNTDRDYARRVAAVLGTVHHEVVASDGAGLEGQLRQLVAQLDEPVWEPSFLSIYLISTLAREHGVKVLLSGDGSDELFGGYPWHPALRRLADIERVPGLRPVLALLTRMRLPATVGTKLRDLHNKYQRSDVAKYHAHYDIFDGPTRAALCGRSLADDPLDALIAPLLAPYAAASLADRFALAELVLWVGEHFNQRLDRMTMAASVEGRVPFQDNAVVDLALALPMAAKLHGGQGKAPLRAAFATTIPSFVIDRPKRPFAAPATAWMQGALRPLVAQALAPESLARLPGLDANAVALLRQRFVAGLPVRQEQIWALLHLTLWAEELFQPTLTAQVI